MAAITSKQERFCQEYVIDLNGTQAAIRAGYSAAAKEQACRLLTKANIQECINELQQQRSNTLAIASEDVVKGLHDIAVDYDAPHSARVQAWNSLGKHLGMFTEKVEHSGELGIRKIERVILEG